MTTLSITDAADFNSFMGSVECKGITFCPHEEGDSFSAYGHLDPPTICDAINTYGRETDGESYEVGARDVQHLYGLVRHRGDSADDEGWEVTWRDVSAETPNAFPLTVIRL